MRIGSLPIIACAVTLSANAAFALQVNDTMSAWTSASPDDKAKLITELLKRDGRESVAPTVVNCLDAASGVPGHADLSIGTVVKACEADGSEPV